MLASAPRRSSSLAYPISSAMKRAQLIEKIKQFFSYNEETGDLLWKEPGIGRPTHKRAGSIFGNGYRYVKVDGVKVKTAHCIWVLKKGRLPYGVVDHIDRNPLNEKWNNLRDVSQADNIRNGKIRKDNNTGVKGVKLMPHGRYWVRKNGKNVGTFATLEEAKVAYDRA